MASESTVTAAFPRARGFPLLLAIITVGMGIPAYLRWVVPRLETRAAEMRASAPTEPEGRLATWFQFGQPNIHNALVLARFSTDRPWYVSHVVASDDPEEPPEVWGIDFSNLSPEVLSVEGMDVVLRLPAPRLLARDVLVGDKAFGVPVFATRDELDPCDLVEARLDRYLERTRAGLQRDIPGAGLVVVVGDEDSPEPPPE